MNDQDWPEMVEHDYAAAKEMLLQSGGVLMTFIVHGDDGIQIVGVPEFDGAMRDMLPLLLRLMCLAYDAVALAHISEGWMLELKRRPDESEAAFLERARRTKPTDSDERVEIVQSSTQYRTADGAIGQACRRGRIVRDAADKPVAVIDLEEGYATERSRWFGLLPTESPSAHDRAMAKMTLEHVSRELNLGLQRVELGPVGHA